MKAPTDLYLSIVYKSENYLVDRLLPHKTYRILCFYNQKELDGYILECDVLGSAMQVKGYFIVIVYTATLPHLNAHSFGSVGLALSTADNKKLSHCHSYFVKNILKKAPQLYKKSQNISLKQGFWHFRKCAIFL